jgi:hypothetical protein
LPSGVPRDAPGTELGLRSPPARPSAAPNSKRAPSRYSHACQRARRGRQLPCRPACRSRLNRRVLARRSPPTAHRSTPCASARCWRSRSRCASASCWPSSSHRQHDLDPCRWWWQASSRPLQNPAGSRPGINAGFSSWAWVGSSLFLVPFVSGQRAWTQLVVSIAGGPFVPIDRQHIPGAAPVDVEINELFDTSTSLYVLLDSGNDCTRNCDPPARMASGTGNTKFGWILVVSRWASLLNSGHGLPFLRLPNPLWYHTTFASAIVFGATSILNSRARAV